MPARKTSPESHAELPTKRPPNGPLPEFQFTGSEPCPVFGDKRHAGLDTKYLEVSPAELIEVAKHLAAKGGDHREAVARAYAIICEAHLVSGNIRRWNEKVSRHHSSGLIFRLVEESRKNRLGQPLRGPLLVALFKALGQGSDASNTGKRFLEWFRHSARFDDYQTTMPWRPDRQGFDAEFHGKLVETGWISVLRIGGIDHLLLPEATAPAGKPPRKPQHGEHATRPYWGTADVWWPKAPEAEVERRRSDYLNSKRDAFLSCHHARQALEKFERWLHLEREIGDRRLPPKRPRGEKGEFVSPADKGAGRGNDGRYRKKSGR